MLIKKKKSPQKNGKIESYGPWPFEDIKFYALKRNKGNKKKKKNTIVAFKRNRKRKKKKKTELESRNIFL